MRTRGFYANYLLWVDQKTTSLQTRGMQNKVLDRQVSLYHGEEETRSMIVKAMTNLFTNGHVTLIPQEQQAKAVVASTT